MSSPNKNLHRVGNENFRSLRPLIVILGPTASGKSELALRLAKKINGEIVSADSRQIYKEMDIATAKMPQDQKPKTKDQKYILKIKNKKLKPIFLKNIPHYLIDIIKPDENFSVAEYKNLAIKIIRGIQRRGKIPILAGGTGLYISAVVDNIKIPKVKPNLKLRKKLEKTPFCRLLKKLEKLDPATYEIIDKKNKRRIIRALEVSISTGKPFSFQRKKGAPLFNILPIGLDMPREKLYKKIDRRIEKMFETGLISETKKLAKKYSYKLPSMSGIGYKEVGMYLRGEIRIEKAKELIKFRTHRYARRQMTWFGKDKRIKWIKLNNKKEFNGIFRICQSFLLNK